MGRILVAMDSRGCLDHMSQLVGKECLPFDSRGAIVASAEHDMISDCVCSSVHSLGRLGGACVRVNSHATEIVSEARFKKGPRDAIEWLAWRTQHLMHDRRHAIRRGWACRIALQSFVLLLAFIALAPSRVLATGALPL